LGVFFPDFLSFMEISSYINLSTSSMITCSASFLGYFVLEDLTFPSLISTLSISFYVSSFIFLLILCSFFFYSSIKLPPLSSATFTSF